MGSEPCYQLQQPSSKSLDGIIFWDFF